MKRTIEVEIGELAHIVGALSLLKSDYRTRSSGSFPKVKHETFTEVAELHEKLNSICEDMLEDMKNGK